ncbi:hypothetical protein HCR_12820 [Hydrogenimonas cancrithermarum]|uniref:Uncharacterized protein n=1 Tax=Hydrogenimonas cancrithermarum TaxID=2993563 RepID=A0ABN6WVI3_9BACT|nr:hypothetical protein HCR_11650 [Hydrogenimonas cancrithermarum]BDY12970.1 hypothetical protein HCR_12820 [Hydrogenimonas cancrithermarum]
MLLHNQIGHMEKLFREPLRKNGNGKKLWKNRGYFLAAASWASIIDCRDWKEELSFPISAS